MERDLITQSLQEMVLRGGKDLSEVQQYLRMKYRIEADSTILSQRLKKIMLEEKAVA